MQEREFKKKSNNFKKSNKMKMKKIKKNYFYLKLKL